MSTDTKDIDPKVLDRIRRLKIAVEAGQREGATSFSTEQEAQAFSSLLQRLLLQHDLQMSDIEYEEKDSTIDKLYVDFSKSGVGELKRPRRVPWVEDLAFVLGPAFNCKIIVVSGSNAPCVVGRKSDTLIFEYMFVTMVRAADDFSEREFKTFRRKMKRTCSICEHGFSWHEKRNAVLDHATPIIDDAAFPWDCAPHIFQNSLSEAHGFKRSWLSGFIARLKERLDEERKRVMDEAAAGGQALVRIDNALVKVNEWMRGNMRTRRAGGLSRKWHHNVEGQKQGRAMADKMNLRGDPLSGGKKTPGQLGE
jgi:hypothetical protein